MNWFNY